MMSRIRVVLALACVLVSPLVAAEDKTRWGEEVQRLARPLIDNEVVPCLVVGLYDGGHTEVHALGLVGDARSPPTGKTIFEVGSITKVFTGLLLADRIQSSKVKLADPLSQYLPKGVKAPSFEGAEITLEHLATHRSALPRIPSDLSGTDLSNPYAEYDDKKLFSYLSTYELTQAPGSVYGYSNLGMGLLGTVLGRVDKTGYEEAISSRIARPLRMSDTVVQLSKEQAKRLAPPHRDGVPMQPWSFQALCGCGGLRSTADDMLLFIAAQIHPEASKLSKSIPLAMARRTDNMALGWFIARDGTTLFHHGQTGGYSSGLYVNPKFKKGAVVLANGASATVDVLSERLIQMLFGMKVEPPTVRKRIQVAEKDLQKLVGDYDSELGFTISVTVRDGGLFAQLTNQIAIRVFPESRTRFFYQDIAAELEFEFDEGGGKKARSVTLFQNGAEMRCSRKGT